MERIRIDQDITVGEQPSGEEIEELSREGFRAVMNLRDSGEEDQPLEPDEEGDLVRALGMEYRHLPVTVEEMDEELVVKFRRELDDIRKPVYVHCRRGKRSGAMAMMDRAVEEGMSGQETLERAEEMGFECDVEELNEFVRRYIDRRVEAGA